MSTYIRLYPEASIGPYEDTSGLLDILKTLALLGLKGIEVCSESVEYSDIIRVRPTMFSRFTCDQVAAIMCYFGGDEITSTKTIADNYIDIWWN